jgi:hypothetical protein
VFVDGGGKGDFGKVIEVLNYSGCDNYDWDSDGGRLRQNKVRMRCLQMTVSNIWTESERHRDDTVSLVCFFLSPGKSWSCFLPFALHVIKIFQISTSVYQSSVTVIQKTSEVLDSVTVWTLKVNAGKILSRTLTFNKYKEINIQPRIFLIKMHEYLIFKTRDTTKDGFYLAAHELVTFHV